MRRFRKLVSWLLIFAMMMHYGWIFSETVSLASNGTAETVIDQTIANGITFRQTKMKDYSGPLTDGTLGTKKEQAFITTVDMNDPTVNIITSKAKEKVMKLETVSDQIAREQFKGHNVVAGINAGFFNISAGTPTYGAPTSLQVKDGYLITGFAENYAVSSPETIFGITKDRKPIIADLSFDGQLSVIDSVYEATYGVPNPNTKTTKIDTFNRDNIVSSVMKDKLILETPQLSENPVITFNNTYIKGSTGAFTVLKNVKGPGDGGVKLGQVYEAEVASITLASNSVPKMTVPEDGMILASQGTKTTWIKNNLKVGDKIRFSFNLDDANGNPVDLEQAIGSWGTLVENGRAFTEQELNTKYGVTATQGPDKARTAIGITADNKVIALSVDGGGSSKESYGLLIPEMALMMQELGAVSAVNLDGGGSTQMNARLYGEKELGVMNNPSDGYERVVTSAILFTSNAPKSNSVHELKVDKDILIYKNTPFTFKVRGSDQGGNPVDLTNADVQWSVRPVNGGSTSGTIDPNGVYRSGALPVTETVNAQIGSVQGSANVTVIDSVYAIGFTDSGKVPLESNKQKAFSLTAFTKDGQPVVISNSSAIWSVSPASLGTFDENGVFTTTDAVGTGTIQAKVGDLVTTIEIIVGQKGQLIDGYELNDPARYSIDGYIGGTHEISTEQVRNGSYSLKVNYDYAKWSKTYNGTINVRTNSAAKGTDYTTNIRPKKLGMWVYGDGKAPWLRAIIADGNNASRTLEMASSINWTGWKYVEAPIPDDVPMPITLNYFYMVETDKSKNFTGTVYFDDVRFSYSDEEDMKEPTYRDVFPSANTVYSADVPFSVTLTDDKTGVDPSSITVTMDGMPIAIGNSEELAHFDATTGILTYTAKGLSEGTHTFTVEAADLAGNRMNPILTKNVTVNLQPDVAPPVISGLLPMDGNILKSSRLKLNAQINDVQSGVYASDVHMALDGQELNVYYDPSNSWAYALPDSALPAGTHILTVNAKDKAGNIAAEQRATFSVVDFVQPADPNKFSFSVTSDTHATGFGAMIIGRINNDNSELVIQNGDLVDNDNAAQWTAGRNQIAQLAKPYMISPGNHEGFNGNLTNYFTYFGDPTYSFEYGNTLFVSLNSALGQSLSGPDPTQLHYLQRVLNENTKPNVVIYTHNPTRDTFGTAHQMLVSDADRFEKMLGDYKANHPDKSVTTIFGHLHVSQSWVKDGVNYVINGDGALKKYVTPQNGGFLSYTQFKVDGANVTHNFIPLAQKIAVVDDAIKNNGSLTLPKGVTRSLNVYGDFTALTADYLVNLSKFADVAKTFTSSDNQIVSVSESGVLTANQVGHADISITISGITTTLPVDVIDQKEVTPIRLTLSPGQNFLNGNEKLVLNVTGYDVFGNTFAIDNSTVNWSATLGLGQVNNGEFTAAELPKDTTGTVIAEFNGMKAQAVIQVSKTVSTYEDSPGGTGPIGSPAPVPLASTNKLYQPDLKELVVQNQIVNLVVPKDAEGVSLPVDVAGRIGQASVVINSADLTMTIPSAVLASAAELLPQDVSNGKIEIKAKPVDAVPNLDLSPGGQVYELTIDVVSDGQASSRLSQFSKPIIIHIPAPQVKNPNLAGIYYIAPNGEHILIGGTYEHGGYTAELSHFSTYGVFEYAKTYQDVASAHWAFPYIQELSFKKIANGMTEDTFAPERSVTRAEFATLLVRALGEKNNAAPSPFDDVKSGDWYGEAVMTAYSMGLVQGSSEGRFEPDRSITREEMATMIVRAVEKKTGSTLSEGKADFQDGNQISTWAQSAVNKAAAIKLIEGRSDSFFAPKGIATRAESAKLILLMTQQK